MRLQPSPVLPAAAARAFALAAALVLPPAVAGAADPPGDPGQGRALARTWCAQCHVVEREAQQRADGLVSFADLARDPRMTPDHLRAFLTRPHGRMPDLTLSRQERDDIIAWLLSLREGGAAPSTDPAPQRR